MNRKHANSISRYTVSLACGPLMKPRYINTKIEIELKEFKAEIKQKFESSEMNRNYIFPKASQETTDMSYKLQSVDTAIGFGLEDLSRNKDTMNRTQIQLRDQNAQNR